MKTILLHVVILAMVLSPLKAASPGEMAGVCSGRTIDPTLERNFSDRAAAFIGEQFGVDPQSPRFPDIFLGTFDQPMVAPDALPRWRQVVRVAFTGPDADAAEAIVSGIFDQVAGFDSSAFEYRIVEIDDANLIVHAGMVREDEGRRAEIEPMFDAITVDPMSFNTAWHDTVDSLSVAVSQDQLDDTVHSRPVEINPNDRLSHYGLTPDCQSTLLMNDHEIINGAIKASGQFRTIPRSEDSSYGNALSVCLWSTTVHAMGALGYAHGLPNHLSEIDTDPAMVTLVLDSGTFVYNFGFSMCAALTKQGARLMKMLY